MALAKTRSYSQITIAIIHHSAVSPVTRTRDELLRRVKAHDTYHAKKGYPSTDGKLGYPDILYHYAVGGDGSVINLQDPKWERWHATDLYKGKDSGNAWGIGILLEGNFQVDQPTQAQLESAAKIIADWNKKHGARLKVRGHGEDLLPQYATSCPGKNMGKSTDPNSKMGWIVARVNQLMAGTAPKPSVPAPDAELVTRRDVVADAVQIVRGKLLSVSSSARKDEWQRVLNYLDKRGKELG